MNLEGFKLPAGAPTQNASIRKRLTLHDRWILDQYNRAIEEVTIAFEEYDISRAARLLYEFIWSKFCDWYLELAKMRLYGQEPGEKEVVQFVLIYVLEGTLKMLHPIMPFITEEIWHLLNSISPANREESIMVASWPLPGREERDKKAVKDMEFIIDIISKPRNVRSVMRIRHEELLKKVSIKPSKRRKEALLVEHIPYIKSLAKSKEVIVDKHIWRPEESTTSAVGDTVVWVSLSWIDKSREIERLSKEIEKIEVELDRINKKLKNREFLKKAPPPVVEKVKKQKEEYEIERDKLLEGLKLIKG